MPTFDRKNPLMVTRLAIVLAVLFGAVGVGALVIPSSPDGVKCGSVVTPDWTDADADELIDSASDLYDDTAGSEMFGGFADQAVGMAANARRNNDACDEARSTRKIIAGSAGGLLLVAPLGIAFVAGGRREDATD